MTITSTPATSTPAQQHRQLIWQVVSRIPCGKVASYGQVAQQAGLPQAARLVGHVLKKLPANSGLPWHRVVNSQGKISLPANSPGYRLQKQRLLAEGVVFTREKISRQCFAWP